MGVSGSCIAFATNQRQRGMLCVGCTDGTIRVYHTETHELLSTLKGHRTAVHSIQFHSDGRLVLTASRDAAILWDTTGTSTSTIASAGTTIGTDMNTPHNMRRMITTTAGLTPFSGPTATLPNGAARAATTLTSRPADAATRVAGAAGDVGWIKKRTLTAGSAFMCEARFTPGGDSLFTCFTNDSVVRWSLDTLQINAKFALPVPATTDADTSLTDTTRKESDGKVVPPASAVSCLRSFTVSSDAKYLLAAGRSSRIFLWDITTKQFLRDIRIAQTGINVLKVDFLPNSSVVAALCSDGYIRFVDVLSTRLILQLVDSRKVRDRCDVMRCSSVRCPIGADD